MPHDPDEPRRYSDEETALILRRAAELQEPDGNSRSAAGFTLAEIQQIAAEAGIDPACVTEAAALISVQEPDRWARIVGAPTRFRYERTVSGELPDPAWAALVQEIRQAMRKPGQVSAMYLARWSGSMRARTGTWCASVSPLERAGHASNCGPNVPTKRVCS